MKKIGIIGGGISGLYLANVIKNNHLRACHVATEEIL